MSVMVDLFREFDVAAFALVLGLLWILRVIQNAQAGGFSWKRAMQDDSTPPKESAVRFGIIVSLVVSSWFLVYITMNLIKTGDDLDKLFPYYIAYLIVWPGTKATEKLIDVLILKFGGKPTTTP